MRDGQAVDRTNRVALLVLGMVLAAVGSYALVRGLGILGEDPAADSVADTLLGLVPDPGWPWLPAVVGSLALLLAILAVLWAAAQVKFPPRASPVTVETTDRGITQVRGSALSHALSTQLARIPGTGDARVRIVSTPSGQRADIRLEIVDGADVPGIIDSAEEAMSRASRLTGLGTVASSIRLVPVADQRVH
ncbi:MAG TPA: hypothetical protein VM754_08780 [Actinomycetota bacterium]|nr:hypothetical protein [Actinomycetota bacterium]